MKKSLCLAFAIIIALALTACGASPEKNDKMRHLRQTQTSVPPSEITIKTHDIQESVNSAKLEQTTIPKNRKGSNILIAYFTWADNTHVENPGSVDVSAITSASVLVPGNTAKLAGWIQEATNGNLFQIITVEPYSSDYDKCLDRAIKEHDSNARPALRKKVSNIDDYDIVFLGYPNWWYSCPMAILTFIEENNLSGKTVIPFCAHGTGGLAASVRDITRALPNDCTVLKAFGSYRPEVAAAKPEINKWLTGLNIEFSRNEGN